MGKINFGIVFEVFLVEYEVVYIVECLVSGG